MYSKIYFFSFFLFFFSTCFLFGQNYSGLVINEIHYNPNDSIFTNLLGQPDTISGTNFEFLEIKNTATTSVDLQNVSFTEGVSLTITNSIVIPPNGFAVFAENEVMFQLKYGFAPDGQYGGKLHNSTDTLYLEDPFGNLIDTIAYKDSGAWPNAADGGFFSAALTDTNLDNNIGHNWTTQVVFYTPRAENNFTSTTPVGFEGLVVNEIFYNPASLTDDEEFIELYNSGNSPINLSGSYFSAGINFTFPMGTSIAAGEYIVLAEVGSIYQGNAYQVFQWTSGNLNNDGEGIILVNSSGQIVDQVTYNDAPPWVILADGLGYSLALTSPSLDNELSTSWDIQNNRKITPGEPNVFGATYSFKIALEGFLLANGNMSLQMNQAGIIPFNQPYNSIPWNYSGTENVSSIPNNAVDWVLIDLFDLNDNLIESKVGFIYENGNIYTVDAQTNFQFSNTPAKISIHHKSHLAVVANASSAVNGKIDFTQVGIALGIQQTKTVNGVEVVYSGDYDGNGIVSNLDYNIWSSNNSAVNTYLVQDGDGNGIVNNLDYNLWEINRSKVGEPVIQY